MQAIQQEQELNHQVYMKLRKKKKWLETHMGKFIGILDGKLVADAESIEEILQKLRQIDSDPKRGTIFQVTKEYPGKIVIF